MFFRFLVFLISAQYATAKSNNVFSVYQILPHNEQQLKTLYELYENTDQWLDFWRAPSSVNNSVDVMVSPEFNTNFTNWLAKTSFDHRMVIEDLAQEILKREIPSRLGTRKGLFGRRLKDDRSSSSGQLPMGEYYSYDDIVEWMRKLERLHPSFVRMISIGSTHEGRNIFGLIIGKKRSSDAKIVWIDAGIHSREWAGVHTALYFIQQIISGYQTDPKIREYVDTLNIYILPCLNPDGYEYTRSDQRNPAKRMWRKNMAPEKCYTKGNRKRCCKGVDLNRNFAFRFGEIGSSSLPCSEIYHGANAFSEPESRAVRDTVYPLGSRIGAFITLHTYSQLWIYPFSNKHHSYSTDIDDIKSVAKKAVEALEKLYGTKYRYGTGPEIIYPYAGGSTDWAKDSAKVRYSYTIELRPSFSDWNGFVLDKRQLVPTGRETWEGVKVVIDKVIEEGKGQRGVATSTCEDVSTSCSSWISTKPSLCRISEHTMKKDCKKSCGFC